MAEFLEVKCPECKCTLFVNRSTGKVVEVRKPVEDQKPGEERFDALVRKAKTRGDAAMEKFAQAKEREKSKYERLDSLFKETLNRVEESGDVGPTVRDVDID
jgi:hypothetical protein